MTAHSCTTLTAGCYRCDLNRDEIEAYADSLLVTYRGVVHDVDCPSLARARWSTWVGGNRLSTDRGCKHCLQGELPNVAVMP